MNLSSLLVLSLLSVGASATLAQGVGQHPATSTAARAAPGIDANTFIVGHPASPRTRAGHANSHHPAVTLAAQGPAAAIDTNHFLVQPPASVQWTMGPAADAPAVATRASAPALASARRMVRAN